MANADGARPVAKVPQDTAVAAGADYRGLDPGALQQVDTPVHRVALGDTPQVHLQSGLREADAARIQVEFNGAVVDIVPVARNHLVAGRPALPVIVMLAHRGEADIEGTFAEARVVEGALYHPEDFRGGHHRGATRLAIDARQFAGGIPGVHHQVQALEFGQHRGDKLATARLVLAPQFNADAGSHQLCVFAEPLRMHLHGGQRQHQQAAEKERFQERFQQDFAPFAGSLHDGGRKVCATFLPGLAIGPATIGRAVTTCRQCRVDGARTRRHSAESTPARLRPR